MSLNETKSLEVILTDWRGDAAVLRRNGHEHDAALIERICADVAGAAEEYLRWLSEDEAILRSGNRVTWFRKRFPEWERAGMARRTGRKREYRMLVVPQGADLNGAREAGRRAGLEAA